MISHFKDKNKIIINTEEREEALLFKKFISEAPHHRVELHKFYNVDGTVCGLSVDLGPDVGGIILRSCDNESIVTSADAYFMVKEGD